VVEVAAHQIFALLVTTRQIGDEAVAAAVQRLDESGASRLILECPPEFLDARGQCGIADRGVCPHRSKQLLLGDHVTTALDEQSEYGERLRCDTKLLRSTPQTLRGMKAIPAKAGFHGNFRIIPRLSHDSRRADVNTAASR
jgi:hypothetical protein